MSWLRQLGFGGVQIWAADLDDFSGSCGSGPYPLLRAVHRALDGYRVLYTYDGVTAAPGTRAGTGTSGGTVGFQQTAGGWVLQVADDGCMSLIYDERN